MNGTDIFDFDGGDVTTPASVDFNLNNIWRTGADAYARATSAKQSAKVEIAKANLASELAKTSRTMAAPGGFLSPYQMANPLPGMWDFFPQAQTKPTPGAGNGVMASSGLLFWVIVGAIAYFAIWALVGKRRR